MTPHTSNASATPELLGIGAVAVLAMALLAVGYSHRVPETATAANPQPALAQPATAGSAASTDRMTQPAQPRSNPADMPNPPSSFPGASGNPSDPTKNNPPNTAH